MSTTVDLGKITASVTVGNTTTGAAGTNASVSNSGTTQDAVLNFTIPRGAQGVQGPQGSTGPQGPAGPTGPQGPMGDVAVITPEQQAAFTMYSVPGQNTDGPMTQKAVTDALIDSQYQEYNVDNGTLITGNIIVSNGNWSADSNNHSFYAIPVTQVGEQFKIVGNASAPTYYAWLSDLTRRASTTPHYATGETGRHGIVSNTTEIVTAPSGTNYLYICNTNNGTSQLPQSVKQVVSIKDSISQLQEDVAKLDDGLEILESENFGDLKTGNVIVSSGLWSSHNDDHSFYYKKVNAGEVYDIKGNSSVDGFYAWLTDVTVSDGGTPNYASGYNNRTRILTGTTIRITVPNTTPYAANYLYICNTNNGTSQVPQYIKRCYTVKEVTLQNSTDIAELKEETHAKEEINLSSIGSSELLITSSGKWSIADGNHKLIPIGYYDAFKITANSNYKTIYAFLADDYCESDQTPHYATGETGRHEIPVGSNLLISNFPSGTNYLYLSTVNNTVDYTPSEVLGYISTADAIMENSERISALEGNTGLTLSYLGSKIDMKTYHYGISRWLTSIAYTHQSGACFGDYYFMLQNHYAGMKVVNLSSGTVLYTGSTGVTGKTATRYHCNQCSFGNIYYDANDPFPLLYVTVQEDETPDLRCSQEVYRVIASYNSQTGDYNSFSLVLVQLIWLPSMTSVNCLGNANMAIDTARNRMVFYSRDDNATIKWCKITEMNIPSFTPVEGDALQTVTLEDTDILNSYFIDEAANNMQGGCIYAGKLFISRGGSSVRYIQLIVVDLMKKCQIALLNPYADGVLSSEPEGCFVYNGQICISTNYVSGSVNNGYFYQFTFE